MIDIVIPVFNAYRHARACVDSVLAHTDLSQACIWLIDDASTDPRIQAWMALLAEQEPRIRMLSNPQNLGFVQTVNRGMRESVDDVVLLNSDTIVTPGWLEKMRACADSRADAATVTPFSNNAEICSYPVFCRNTRIEGLDTHGLVKALEDAFDGSHPEIPTAVGFCMFIRRRALDEIGLFDADRFGKGYGEENDFCWRARKAGWVHLLCSNAWVSHLGGQSFTEQTASLKQLHLQRLLERHPDYHDRIAEFVASDPVAPYRKRIVDALTRAGLDELGQARRRGVLLVTHAMGGGIEKHVQDLVALLQEDVRVEVLMPHSASTVVLRDTLGNECVIGTERTAFDAAIRARGYSRIHIHHLHGYPQSCAEALQSLGVPVDITMHDFAYWCPQYNLSLANGLYCGERGPEQCARCLAERPHAWQTSIGEWRDLQRRWMTAADRVIAPSGFMAQRIRQSWPDMQIRVWPHPPRHEWTRGLVPKIRVGMLGGVSAGKGLEALVECAAHAAVRGLPVEFTVIGYTSRGIPVWPDLPIRITGGYDDADLPGMVQGLAMDCLWLASVIPESYSYTLDAALQTGLPLIANRSSGAVADRLAQSASAFALLDAPATAADFMQALMRLLGPSALLASTAADVPQEHTQRLSYKQNLLEPVLAAVDAGSARLEVPALAVLPSANAPHVPASAPDLPLPALLEQALDCGHRPSQAALRARALELHRQLQALSDLETREGKRWHAYLDDLHSERANLYAERESMLSQLDAQADHIKQWTLHAQELRHQLDAAEKALDRARIALSSAHSAQQAAESSMRQRERQIEELTGPLNWLRQWYAVKAVIMFLRMVMRIESTLATRLRAVRRIASVLARGLRRWPVALSVLRHEGPAALWRRVRQKLRPPEPSPPTVPSLTVDAAPPTITPLALNTMATGAPPQVSIVIPVYGQHAYTFQCLQSLAVHTDLTAVEVIVIDDASPDAAQAALSEVSGVRWMRNPQNMGFLLTCNRAVEAARGEFVVLLNNDVQVTAGWLPALLSVFESRADAGLVGAQLLYPDGRLQEAGGIVWKDGSAWNWGRLQDPMHPAYQYLRPVDYCSGACLAIRTSTWQALGGFDPTYVPAYYEDTDLAFRIRKAGWQVYYQPACRVIHHEGISSGTDETRGIKRHQVINHTRFFQRWQSELDAHEANGVDPLRAVTRWARKRMLVVEACMITPDQDSGSVRMLAMLRILTGLGVQVSFIADNLEGREPYASQLRGEGVEVWHAPHVHSVAQLLQERGRLFDVVMLCRHYIAAPLLVAVRKHAPQAQVWFDTVDLHYLREERVAVLEKSAAVARTAAQTREQETGVIRSCDVTIVVSPVEQAVLAKEVPGARVEIVSNIHDVQPDSPGFASRCGLLFVGGFQHPPNIDAVQWFVGEVWPLIRAKAPDMVVRIVGSKMPEKLRALQGNGVEILGFVQDIEPLLDSSRVSIAPLRYGAGVKGKVNQAMAHGLPVVATSVAVEGMGLTVGEHVLVGDSPQQFADAVLEAHEDEACWRTLAAGGQRNIEEIFSSRVARQALRKLVYATNSHWMRS